jgi:hypothetical protein
MAKIQDSREFPGRKPGEFPVVKHLGILQDSMGQYERAISHTHSLEHDPGEYRPPKCAQINMVARAGLSDVKIGKMKTCFPETDSVFGETDMVMLLKRVNGACIVPGLAYLI